MSVKEDSTEVKAWVDPRTAGHPQLCTDATETTADPAEGPNAFIQWKGTEACLDYYCPCGVQSHYDGYFAYSLECPGCRREFVMPSFVQLIPAPDRGSGR